MAEAETEAVLDDNDIDNEDLEIVGEVPWLYHPLRAFLLHKMMQGLIPVDYKLMKPSEVWETFCDDDAFEGFEYDTAFKRRLLSLRHLVDEGKKELTLILQHSTLQDKTILLRLATTEMNLNGMALQHSDY